jgi:hypothetical protein
MTQPLLEGVDYTINSEGLMVFTSSYLLKRGYCCGSGCINCPYEKKCEESLDPSQPVKDTLL